MSVMKIDGSLGKGGGQILRIAISLSALYKIPIEIENIRVRRSKPGLAAQHLKAVEIAQSMCNAQVKGAYLGSTRLEFIPGVLSQIQKRTFHADIQTAGCTILLAQAALPIALFLPPGDPITLILRGGTNVPMGPHIEYLTEVFRPWLNKFGADFDFTVLKRGYYPKGGGEIHLRIPPIKSLNSVEMLQLGDIKSISGWAYVAGSVPLSRAYNMAEVTKNAIHNKLTDNNIQVPSINIEAYREDREMAVGNGSGINVVCQLNGGSVFGGSGLGSNRCGSKSEPTYEAAEQIINSILDGSCIDKHMQDQMILLMALAHGRSRMLLGKQQLTFHTETAIKVIELMLGDRGFRCQVITSRDAGDSKKYILECDGCSLINGAN